MNITPERVEEAYDVVKKYTMNTPVIHSKSLSKLCDGDAFFKCENLQMTGAFKERGALFKASRLSAEERKRGVIAASAGNHAQGVAYAAQTFGMDATIVMPKGTPLVKVSSTRALGAEVILKGDTYDDASAFAAEKAEQDNLVYIHPFDDEDIIAGQGTIGIELVEAIDTHNIDTIVCSIGGGGLITGVGAYLKAVRPYVKIIGVEAESCPAMKESLKVGARVQLSSAVTLAEGTAVKKVGEHTFAIAKSVVDDVLTVDDSEIANAILRILENEKMLTEGAGAIGFAAHLKYPEFFKGKRVCHVLSGGNLDVNRLNRIIFRGMTVDDRLCRLRIRLQDRPGALGNLSDLFHKLETNILDISHHRGYSTAPFGYVDVSVTLEAKGADHVDHMLLELKHHDFPAIKETNL